MSDSRLFTEHIEPTFGSYLFTLLRNQRYLLRLRAERDGNHLVGACCLEIEIGRNGFRKRIDVRVLYMAAVFAKMRCNSIGSGALANPRGVDRAWLVATSRLSQCRNVVDVYIQSQMSFKSCWHLDGLLSFAPTFVECS